MSTKNQQTAFDTLKQGYQGWNDEALDGAELVELFGMNSVKLKLIRADHFNRQYRTIKEGVEVLKFPLEILIEMGAYAAADKLLALTKKSIDFISPFRTPDVFEKASHYLKYLAQCGRDLYLTFKQSDAQILDKLDESNCTVLSYINAQSEKLKAWVMASMHESPVMVKFHAC